MINYEKQCPVTTMQSYFWDCQEEVPDSTIFNLSYLLKFGDGIEAGKLAAAFTAILRHQESVQTVLFQTADGERMQRFAPELTRDVEVEQITEEKMEELRKTLIEPFVLEGQKLYRCRVFQTEKAVYAFWDIHHIIFDGWSGMIFWNNLAAAYRRCHLQPDYYYESLKEQQLWKESALYLEGKRYYEKTYGGLEGYDTLPRTDEQRAVKCHRLYSNEPLEIEQEKLREYEKKYNIDHNIFFLTVTAMATGAYNDTEKLFFTWTYHGRYDRKRMKSVGMFIRDLPVKIDLSLSRKTVELYDDLKHQIEQGIRYHCYSYTLLDEECASIDQLCYIYQGSMGDVTDFCGISTENIKLDNQKNEPENIMDVRIEINSGEFYLVTDCDSAWYRKTSIRRYRRLFTQIVRELLEDK